jgi:hypothetical protein
LCASLRCRRRKKTAGWAVRASWASREAEAQWGDGGRLVEKKKKKMGRGWAESPDGPKVKEKVLF